MYLNDLAAVVLACDSRKQRYEAHTPAIGVLVFEQCPSSGLVTLSLQNQPNLPVVQGLLN